MTGKENTEKNIKNALLDGAFYYLQDKEWQNNSIFSKVIHSKETAEHILFAHLQHVGIDEFKQHARSLGGVDFDKIVNNIQRDYAIALYYLCNDLHELTTAEAKRDAVMHRFGWSSQDLSNHVHQFRSHKNKKFKRDNYPVMVEVFNKLVTPHKGRPKQTIKEIDVCFTCAELDYLYHVQKLSVLEICDKLEIKNYKEFYQILKQFNIAFRHGKGKQARQGQRCLIERAVGKFITLKLDKNYKSSALVKLCKDHASCVSDRNITLCENDFYDFLFSFSPAQLADISSGKLTYWGV